MKLKTLIMILLLTLFLACLVTGIVYAASGDLTVTGSFNLLPPGTVIMYTGSTAPDGWLLADGSQVSRTTYAALFAVIGTTFGAGNVSTTFNLPDFRRRVAVGAGGTATAALGNAVGSAGGTESTMLTTAQIPAHSHVLLRYTGWTNSVYPSPNGGVGQGYAAGVRVSDGWTQETGSGQPHDNIQPSLVVNYIIKY